MARTNQSGIGKSKKNKKAASQPTMDQRRSQACRQFMIALYQQIGSDAAAPTTTSTALAGKTLRRARLARFLHGLPVSRRSAYQQRLLHNSNTPRVETELVEVRQDLAMVNAGLLERLRKFVDEFGLVTLSICSHSSEFDTMLRDTGNSTKTHPFTWPQVLNLIRKHEKSLELFAKTRGLGWAARLDQTTSAMTHIITHLRQLLKNHGRSLSARSFGANNNDYSFYHPPDDVLMNLDPPDPHLWYLPHAGDEAQRCTLVYKEGRKQFKEEQESITDSQVCTDKRDYTWPRKDQWPISDPRYCHPADKRYEPCRVCRVNNGDRDLAPTRAQSVKVGVRRSPRRQEKKEKEKGFVYCGCRSEINEPLVELFDNGRTGVGVRALQDIPNGEVIGEYVGEVYPYRKGTGKLTAVRYAGTGYRVRQDVYVRDLGPKIKSKKRGKTDDDGEDTGGLEEGKLKNNEVHSYVVDAARYGNWTRFLNHSCNAHAYFVEWNVGQLQRIMVKTQRKVQFGEEITIDYCEVQRKRKITDGEDQDDFFNNLGCRCGWARCKRWDSTKPVADIDLKSAMEAGVAPAWALDAPTVPWEENTT